MSAALPTPLLAREELLREVEEIIDGVDLDRARMVDAMFFDRLALERAPTLADGESYRRRVAGKSPFEVLRTHLPDTPAQMRYPHLPCVNRELMWQRDDGLRLWFNLLDLAVGVQICQGTFDPENEQLLARLVAPGMNVVDIGANLGYYTLLMARAGAKVYAFEAFPYNHQLLEMNLEENRLGGAVTTRLVGCASSPGTGRICSDPTDPNLGSMFVLTDDGASAPQGFECQEIPLARVDDLVPETDRIAVVKIDAEGSELDVFQGMDRILSVDRPVILMELNSTSLRDHRGVEPKELIDLLFSYDYRVAEATSVLAGQPAMVGGVPIGAQVFANMVCFPA